MVPSGGPGTPPVAAAGADLDLAVQPWTLAVSRSRESSGAGAPKGFGSVSP